MIPRYNLFHIGLLAAFLIIFWVKPANAQSASYKWANAIAGTGAEIGYSVNANFPGFVYTVGSFATTVDFDPGLGIFNLTAGTAVGIADGFVQKLDTAGNFVWAKQIGGSGIDRIFSVDVDSLGGLYLTGIFSGTADLDPGPALHNVVSAGAVDIFVLHLDSGGNFVWGRSIGGSGSEEGNSIVVDSLGNVYVTGNFASTVDFDPGVNISILSSNGGADMFLLKLGFGGNFVWAKRIGGANTDSGESLALDGLGNLVVTGSSYNIVDFDPGPGIANLGGANSSNQAFVAKYDTAGNYIWAKDMGSTAADFGKSVTVDDAGSILVTGDFRLTVDFDPGPGVQNLTSNGDWDIFICKLDALGNLVWVKALGGGGEDLVYSIKADASNNVYISGFFASSVLDVDPGVNVFSFLNSNVGGKSLVLKLNSGGSFVWARNYGGGTTNAAQDVFTFLNLDNLGNIYLTGIYYPAVPADFDPGQATVIFPSAGNSDAYVLKLGQGLCGGPVYSSLTVTACDSFILGGQKFTSSGNPAVILSNSAGCDSVVVLNLTIKNSSTFVVTQTGCDSIVYGGQAYTQTGVYTSTYTNAVGCDSFFSLNLTILQSSYDTIVQTSCDSFTYNGVTFTSSGYYSDTLTNGVGCDSIITLNLTINSSLQTAISQSACDSFTLNGTTYLASGVYTQTLSNIAGCDSVLTLNLTINSVDASVVKSAATISANATGASYQWVDCDNNYAPIQGETNQSYTASFNGNYAVIVTQNGCTDTSECKSVTHLTDGVEDIESSSFIKLFPNPTSIDLMVNTTQPLQNGVIRIMTAAGKVVLERYNLVGDRFHLDVSGYANGLYLVEVKEAGKIFRAKVVKH